MRFAIQTLVCVGAVLFCRAGSAAEPTAEAVRFFENDVRPILVRSCIKCHGPKKQEASFSLASRTAFLKGSDNGAVFIAGKPEESTLVQAIRGTGDFQMPPDGLLPEAEITILVKWVEQGAPWPADPAEEKAGEDKPLWSLQPVKSVEPPTVNDPAWNGSAIDRFVQAQREQKQLPPVGLADKRTLLRRVTFDLTGLPPTPAEIDSFLGDESPEAYARVIERLLASPHYGERWGRHWLDVARYADTAGDGADYPVREAAKYRDWVVRALNADQPYDQFLREQLAGDILAAEGPREQYADRVTATGFLAVGKRYGYAPNTDYQYLDFADTIDSVGRSLLGLSIGCARCHDHKYDPISAADYYALYGIFESTKWSFPGGEEHKRPTHFPSLVPPDEAARLEQAKAADLAQLEGALARLKQERSELSETYFAGGADLAFEGQPLEKAPAAPWLSVGPNGVYADAQSPFTHIHPTGTRGVRIGSGGPNEGVRYVFENGLRAVPGEQMHFTIDFRTIAPADKTGSYRFYLGRGVIASQAVEFSVSQTEFAIKNGASWEVVRAISPGTWNTLSITMDHAQKSYSGGVGVPGDLTVFENKGLNPAWDGIFDTFICDGNGHVAGTVVARELDNLGLQAKPFAAPGSPAVPPRAAPTEAQKLRLTQIDTELAAVTRQRDAMAVMIPYEVTYGVSEGTPVNAKIQKRGEPDKLGDEVPRRFLDVLGGDRVAAESKGSGRLELAQWITRPTNPLTARVFVNRVWQWHFGRGLVPTASDFGTRGELPTHPELLDWLAADFMQTGWSLKGLHRKILLSRTYQLSSADQKSNLEADPGNVWLWRFSRQALNAEAIRDAMLAVSGQLDVSPPQPHPFPPVDTWGFTIHAPFHAVYDHKHRSLYLMAQRNRRHPFLAMFDAADPNQSTAERLPTVTPTQTLYLMNSPFVHEQSTAFGQRLLKEATDDAARVRLAFKSAHGADVSEADVEVALQFLGDYQQQLAAQGIAADQQPVMAWAALARVLLTSNAFLAID